MISKKLSPHLVALIAFTIFIGIFCLTYLLIPSPTKQLIELPQTVVSQTDKSEVAPSSTISESKLAIKISEPDLTNDTVTTKSVSSTLSTTKTANQSTSTIIAGSIPFTFQVLNTEILSETKSGTNVIDAMKKLQTENKITFSGKEFSNLGFFVSTVNGQSVDTAKGLYWFLYINDKSSNIGASQYVIKPNDKIEWRFKKSNF